MAFYVIAASPLVKCYLPEWHERLSEDPDLLFDDQTPFEFDVPRGSKAFKMKFNTPILVTGNDEKESLTLYQYLIGELAHTRMETNQYGIVPFETGTDLVQQTDRLIYYAGLMASVDPKIKAQAQKDFDRTNLEMKQGIDGARAPSKALSEKRIKTAMKIVHNNLIRQWQINEEMKLGKYPPSLAEMFGAVALDKEIQAKKLKDNKSIAKMNELMNNIST